MKALVLAVALLATMPAVAVTWVQNGILYGNVCRYGLFYTVYPVQMGQPVGTMCLLRDAFGNPVGVGRVSNE